MAKETIAVRVDRMRWRAALSTHKTSEVQLAKKIGRTRSCFSNWLGRRGGFPYEIVDALTEAGMYVHEYAAGAETPTTPKDIEDAFVRALERFYGVKEGEFTQWFITTMNAVTKHACREVVHDSQVSEVQRDSERPGEDLRTDARRGGRAGGYRSPDFLQASGFAQGHDTQRIAANE